MYIVQCIIIYIIYIQIVFIYYIPVLYRRANEPMAIESSISILLFTYVYIVFLLL